MNSLALRQFKQDKTKMSMIRFEDSELMPVASGWYESILQYDRLFVAVMAILAAGTWYVSEPIVFTNDSFGYVYAAKYIAGVPAHGIPYYRMLLFPILLVGTGVAKFSTFFWFVLTQTALGVAMVMVFHDGLRSYSRTAAFLATAVFAFTFVPFVYSKSVMTEQLYLSGVILCLSSTLNFLHSGRRFHLLLIAAAVLVMTLTRVQGIFIGFLVFPFLLASRPQFWKPVLAASAAVAVTMGAYAVAYSAQVRKHELFRSASATEASLSNSIGKYLFMVPYLDAPRYFGWKIVEPGNGPSSTKLFQLIEEKPATIDQWWAIWQTLDKEIGVVASNNLLLGVTIEALTAHPFKAAAVYGHNLVVSTFRLNSSYVWAHPSVTIDDSRLNDEFKKSGDQSSVTLLATLVNPLFHTALILATILVVLTIGPHGSAWAFCVALYAYNLLSIAASGAPEGRIVFYALPLLLAALAVEQAKPWLLRWTRHV
jgi:hypothetical protein